MRPIVAPGEPRRPRTAASAVSRRTIWLAGPLAVVTACRRAPTNAASASAISFSVPTDERVSRRRGDWRPLFADLEQLTGLRVKPIFAPNDAALLAAMNHRQVDAGWFSSPAALAAVRSANGEVFARTIAAGDEVRRAALIAKPGGPTLDAIRRCDRQLAYGQGPPESISGHLAPIAFFFGPEKLDPRRCFREVASADAETNLRAVESGALDVAAIDAAALTRSPATDTGVVAIWTSPPLPQDPIIWRRDLDPDAKERLRQFFITYGRGEGALAQRQRAVLAPLDVGGFEVADDNQLLLAREIEARERLALAEWSGDAARTQAARRVAETIAAERQAYDDRVPVQAGAP